MGIYKDVPWLAYKRAETITDEEVERALAAMKSDPRVSLVEYAGRGRSGGPIFKIKATNCAEGDLEGTYSLGRCLNALSRTQAQYEEHIATVRAQRAEHAKYVDELKRREEAERVENRKRLQDAGISPQRLSWICNCLARGVYLDDDALEDWAWYAREIVRRRPAPMALHRYVAGFVRS